MRNEADTRADLIDPKLVAAGWGAVDLSQIKREQICPGRIISRGKRSAPVSSDYVLIYKGRKLAVVEAKREALSYTEGVRQAKDYAERLQCRIAYGSNGKQIYQIDMHTGVESLVDEFLSPDALWQLTFAEPKQDAAAIWRERFAAIPFEMKGDWLPRYYQENAINNALEAIARGEQRILLTLATGTGKTCIGFQTAWKLYQSRWSLGAQTDPTLAKKRPRILFLADRNILANQAFNAFGAFGEDAVARIDPKEIRKLGGVPKNASVFFTIFQTFMSGGEDEAGEATRYFDDYPKDFFDLVIIDECHRGGANDESSWRKILERFSPAVQIGLTATPKRTVNADTYNYFGEPVYSYTLKEGINDGFLTPFKVLQIVGTMDEYVYMPNDGVVVEGEPEPGKVYTESDFNRTITIQEREKMRVQYWMDRCNPNHKAIVFCATQKHAGLVRDYINQYAVERGWTSNRNYCVRVTANDGAVGEKDLETFQDNEKTIPTVLTTSRKLSTGVDAKNVRHIVLMRPCNNMIEFKQIIGRGTRTYSGKDFFTVFDFVKAHQNFADPEWDGEPEPIAACTGCGEAPCVCEKLSVICELCNAQPCSCPKPEPQACEECGQQPCECPSKKVEIKLSDGRVRQIQHISSALYWSAEGKPVTGQEFMQQMFGDLPRFFSDEDQLRAIWGDPTTREKLLEDLSEAGYDGERLALMKQVIGAEDSDVYDVLAYVAYAAETQTRTQRVRLAKPRIVKAFASYQQQTFIDFILEKYIEDGVQELSQTKMRGLVELKYNTISDAAVEFGGPAAIRETFVGFQKYLYANE